MFVEVFGAGTSAWNCLDSMVPSISAILKTCVLSLFALGEFRDRVARLPRNLDNVLGVPRRLDENCLEVGVRFVDEVVHFARIAAVHITGAERELVLAIAP